VDNLNQLTSVVRTNSSATVAGTTTSAATNVTVAANGGADSEASRFADGTFARTNVTLVNGTNTFTAVALDAAGRSDTNTISAYLPAAVTFLFDQNGNMRTNGTRIFEYDDENQLTRIAEPNAWKSEFSYDGNMRRRMRKEWTWQNGAWVFKTEVRYVYDGKLVIQERDTFNVPNVTYIRGKDLSGSLEGAGGIGGLLARVDNRMVPVGDGRGNSYYAADGNGNVTCLVDTNQMVVARYVYDPFGNTVATTGRTAEANLYRYSSKELHEASSLFYYLYRLNDPNLQRWPNRDPIDEIGFSLLRPLVGRRQTYDTWNPVVWESLRRVRRPNNSMFTFVPRQQNLWVKCGSGSRPRL
jgi:RHS repeat-associated protein